MVVLEFSGRISAVRVAIEPTSLTFVFSTDLLRVPTGQG